MSDLLKLARKYQKNKEWKKAISNYEKYVKEVEGKCGDKVYASYARCLRRLGYINQAEKVLQKGQTLHPQSKRILKELYNLYSSRSDKEKAKSAAQSLVDLDPKNSSNYFRLGKVYASMLMKDEAKMNYITAIEYQHGMTIDELMEEIRKGFVKKDESVSSEYTFVSGRSNYGSFVHTYKGKKYFTKISGYTQLAKRERTFYKDLCEDFPVLKELVPTYIDSIVIDGILYLTLEMLETAPVENVNDIIITSREITTIPYKEIVKKYPNLRYSFGLKNKPNPLTILFTKIHSKVHNEKLFSSLYKLTKQNKYPDSVKEIIQTIESMIMDNQLYYFIIPEKHYSLMHGDFNRSNVQLSKLDQHIKVLDWETFKIGPHFIDIARHLSGTLAPYSQVKEMYLDNEKMNGSLSLIEKIFFLYALILLYILTLREKQVGDNLDKYITPALQDMQELVSQFIKTDYFLNVNRLTEKGKKDKSTIAHLKNVNSTLKKKINILERRHQKMLNSKSWKVTAPMRKLVLKLKGNN